MKLPYYSSTIADFLDDEVRSILGGLSECSDFSVEKNQIDAWSYQIEHLKHELKSVQGTIFMEFPIPRMGKRIDVILISGPVLYVLEYKVGARKYAKAAINQVTDYALDLKNFHDSSHDQFIVPILIATNAKSSYQTFSFFPGHKDKLLKAIRSNGERLQDLIETAKNYVDPNSDIRTIDVNAWRKGQYNPTPTIIEAAIALFNGHDVNAISRSDASGEELNRTVDAIQAIILDAKKHRKKCACFVTGVPGAGKTLVGLKTANEIKTKLDATQAIYLSGNGPLVKILQEALAIDHIKREKKNGNKILKEEARTIVKSFIQNVHHYRDDCVHNKNAPSENIAIFDEAQRAWDLEQTSKFMKQKKKIENFDMSEPEFLISCIDRHNDWGVVICLVGGGQEIHVGEAGIKEWIYALNRKFGDWHVYISKKLHDEEFGSSVVHDELKSRNDVHYDDQLHLSVTMRSFRAEHLSRLVKQLLDIEIVEAQKTFNKIKQDYPIVLTRDLNEARSWLRQKARGNERFGIVVSSQANRLRPLAIDVRLKPNPVHWFLADEKDVRSSYFLEDAGTEFNVQGLELDWVCLTWDADFRFDGNEWLHRRFRGNKWQKIEKAHLRTFLKNAYRVLLTRARQGMVIVVPEGDERDPTRKPEFYDPTFEYLKSLNFEVLE